MKSWYELLGNKFTPKGLEPTGEVVYIPIIYKNTVCKKSEVVLTEFPVEEEKKEDVQPVIQEEKTTALEPVQTTQYVVKKGMFGKLKVKEI